MNDRALQVLKSLIERYIAEGQPVGSKLLAQDSSLRLSPASIRSIMADLEKAGYLHSPHTSAGRIPTAQGYRLFVDRFVEAEPLTETMFQKLRQQLSGETDKQLIINQASSLLSEVTHLAGVVSIPRKEKAILKQVEFVSLSENRILVILILASLEVQNRVIYTQRHYTPSELEQAANYLTAQCAGKDLEKVRESLLQAMHQDRFDLEHMLKTIMEMTEQSMQKAEDNTYVLMGESQLLQKTEQAKFEQLKRLFETFERKRDVLHLLDQALQADGLKIFIGQEAGYSVFDEYSLVTAPYSVQGRIVGVLGVIGPTRMPYNAVISAVNVTAKLLSHALGEDNPLNISK